MKVRGNQVIKNLLKKYFKSSSVHFSIINISYIYIQIYTNNTIHITFYRTFALFCGVTETLSSYLHILNINVYIMTVNIHVYIMTVNIHVYIMTVNIHVYIMNIHINTY